MKYFVVDAFANEPFGGNPAGVVLLGESAFPAEETMIRIAAELRYSETAFVQQNGTAEFTVRYFTPAAEVDLCGHATIASFSVLRDEAIVPVGTVCCNHTLAGDLEVIVGEEIMMQMATPQILSTVADTARLYKVMGAILQENCSVHENCYMLANCSVMENSSVQQGSSFPSNMSLLPQIVSTGLPDIIMPVGSVEALQALSPDMAALSALSAELEVVGVHAFALSDDGYTAHVRNFAPLYDIPEESATGTANAALTYYLLKNGIVPAGAECSFMQGEAMNRPSVVATKLREDGTVYVGGNSYILAKGEMFCAK